MAFTNYKTWASGETLTSANFNQQIRDNGLAMGPHLIARKTSDQSVTSSTTLVDDATLQLSVLANEVWLFHVHVRYEAGVTEDFKVSFSFPASGRIDASPSGSILAANGTFTDQAWSMTTSDTSVLNFTGGGSTTRTLLIDGTYIGAGTPGTVILRWAQNTSGGTATKVLAQSSLWAVKLA